MCCFREKDKSKLFIFNCYLHQEHNLAIWKGVLRYDSYYIYIVDVFSISM